MKKYFVSGIGTEIGKTIVSAIFVEALKADYFKPIQAGDLDNSDTSKVQKLVTNNLSYFHSETYRLNTPMSPHAAAEIDNVKIDLEKICIPQTQNNIIVEGAGGLMVPLNEKHLMIDLIQHLDIPVVLVSKNYLGSINHTILSIESLQKRDINIAGIVFNGKENNTTEEYILDYCKVDLIGRVDEEKFINQQIIKHYADKFKNTKILR